MLDVYILTRCESPQALYGSLLVFPTLRTGFPTARIHVFENCSHPEAREPIKTAALQCQAEFTQLDKEVGHHGFLEDRINRQQGGTAVFVDPDICFWSNIESWRFDALVAGRFIPRFRCEYTRCLVHPRVHTSLFWVPDVRQVRDAIYNLRHREFFFDFEPFKPVAFKLNGEWHRSDTGGSLLAAFPERVRFFSETELDCYDHLFCGSHLDYVAPRLTGESGELLRKLHADAQRDPNSIRGAWRKQEEHFVSRKIE